MIQSVARAAGRAFAAAGMAAALLAAPIVAGATIAGPAMAQDSPQSFLQDFSDRALERLGGDISAAERQARFDDLLDEGFDVPAISQFILARYWRTADEEAREAFVDVFKDYLGQRFLPLFDGGGSDFDLRFGEGNTLQGRDDLFDVPVTFAPSGGSEPINTTWRVRQQDGDYKILDVRAEGVSLAVTLRDEYSTVIRRAGGVDGLVEELRRLVESGQVSPARPTQGG
jgi:phospholipid transport system substrate-binding protein